MHDEYMKPYANMLKFLKEEKLSLNQDISLSESFHVGDAVGRSGVSGLRDFSRVDFKFSKNMGFRFVNPE